MKELLVILLLVSGGVWRSQGLLVVAITLLAAWVVWLERKNQLSMGKLVKWGGVVGMVMVLSGLWLGFNQDWRWWVMMWLSGFLMGLVATSEKRLNWSRIILGASLSLSVIAWWLGDKQSGISLVTWATQEHHHLADWWGVALLGVSWWWWPVGFWWLVVGRSRAAYVSLLVGWWWLKKGKKLKWFRWLVIGVVVVLSIWVSRVKPVLSHRVYWFEAMRGLIEKPQGYGWGQFFQVSDQYRWRLGDCGSCVSSYAHNIWLEVGVDGGWLIMGMMMWWWLKIGQHLKTRSVIEAMLMAVMINMLVDYTYLIPAMWWLFWGLLGRMEADD